MNGYYDPADYDGLTDEEIAAMRKDTERDRYRVGSKPIWTSKTKLGYTPIFIGKSGAVYVGGVKLEGVRFAESTCETHGINTLCIVFDTDRVVDMREKTRTTLLEPDATELREVLERVFRQEENMEEDRFLSVCKKIVADYTNKHIDKFPM